MMKPRRDIWLLHYPSLKGRVDRGEIWQLPIMHHSLLLCSVPRRRTATSWLWALPICRTRPWRRTRTKIWCTPSTTGRRGTCASCWGSRYMSHDWWCHTGCHGRLLSFLTLLRFFWSGAANLHLSGQSGNEKSQIRSGLRLGSFQPYQHDNRIWSLWSSFFLSVAHVYFLLAAIFGLDLAWGDIRLCVENRKSRELCAVQSHWPTMTDKLVDSLRFSGNTEHRLKVGELSGSFHYFPTASELLNSWSHFHRDPYLSPSIPSIPGVQRNPRHRRDITVKHCCMLAIHQVAQTIFAAPLRIPFS